MAFLNTSPGSLDKRGAAARSAVLGSFLSVLLLAVGCDRQGTPTTAIPAPLPNTPEGKLEGVMRRLKSALDDAQAAAGSGVSSERNSSFNLIKPTDANAPLRAEVTISTKLSARQTKDEKAKGKDDEQSNDKNGKQDKASIQPIEPITKNETFSLVYEGDKWKMEKPPEGEIEQLCFDYALKGQ
jgi:hypothetical protein